MKKNELSGTWLLEALSQGGVNISTLLEVIPDIVERTLQGPEQLHPDEVNQLLMLSAESSGEDDLGLMLLELVDISMYGTYGYLLSNARTVQELLELATKYYSILYWGNTIKFEMQDNTFTIEYIFDSPITYCSRHFTEWTLGFFCNFFQSRLGVIATPTSAHFSHSSVKNIKKQNKLFGSNIHFNQPNNILTFNKHLLDCKLSSTAPDLLKIVLRQAESALQHAITDHTFESKIRLLILENLESRTATAKKVALQLNLSLSTFKRKLNAYKLDFRQLRDEVRNTLAKELLSSSDSSINQIAFNSGFAEQSAFSRFFIRVNQVSPVKYRRKQQHLALSHQ